MGLVGPNGAGKTTLLNLVTGFLSADSGTIRLFGEETTNRKNLQRVKMKIGVIPQEIALYDSLSVIDNLKYFGELYRLFGQSLSNRIEELLKSTHLYSQRNERVRLLSGGMKRRLNLISGLLHSPSLLLMDEPTVGVDLETRFFIYDLINELKKEGKTFLYTTHYLPEVEKLCDRAAILKDGKIIALGRPQELISSTSLSKEFESAYLELTKSETR